jgi:type II secretory pathway pseudopilin PulG
MKKHIKSIAGVTLLEIMLVLAIASMVIVMSIRYYQNATNSSNTNILLAQVQNITAAADNLAQGGGSYSALTASNLASVAGASNLRTPYGTSIAVANSGGTAYTVSIPGLNASVCTQLSVKLRANPKFASPACAAGTLTYTYRPVS